MSVGAGTAAFWHFWNLRERARLHKEAGGPPPDDSVVKRWRFCNVYRDLDRGTKWFAARRGAGLQQVLWRSLTYRTVNRLETFEAADAEGAATWWQEPEAAGRWLEWLAGRVRAGAPVFGGRHCTRGLPRLRETLPAARSRLGKLVARLTASTSTCPTCKNHRNVEHWCDGALRHVGVQGNLKFACAVLKELPHVGDFYAWQVARDLVEAGELPEDESWALPGAGARRGATLVRSGDEGFTGRGAAATAATALQVMRALRDGQDEAAALGLDRSRWHRVPVTLADVEHALCEFSRYEALRTAGPGRVRCEAYRPFAEVP